MSDWVSKSGVIAKLDTILEQRKGWANYQNGISDALKIIRMAPVSGRHEPLSKEWLNECICTLPIHVSDGEGFVAAADLRDKILARQSVESNSTEKRCSTNHGAPDGKPWLNHPDFWYVFTFCPDCGEKL